MGRVFSADRHLRFCTRQLLHPWFEHTSTSGPGTMLDCVDGFWHRNRVLIQLTGSRKPIKRLSIKISSIDSVLHDCIFRELLMNHSQQEVHQFVCPKCNGRSFTRHSKNTGATWS